MDFTGVEYISAALRDREATLKVGALTSDSKWGGGEGSENTFPKKLFIIFKKVGGLNLPSPLRGPWLLKIM